MRLLSYLAVLAIAFAAGSPGMAAQPFAGCLDEFWNGQAPIAVGEGYADALCNAHFATLYSETTETPLYSAEHLTRRQLEAAIHLHRAGQFHEDDRLPPAIASSLGDYRGSGFDRGHMAPDGDMPTRRAQSQSFRLSNIVPQNADDNRHLWADIEYAVRGLVLSTGDDAYVVTGPIFDQSRAFALHGRVKVPTLLFKAVYVPAAHIAGVYVAENGPGNQYQVFTPQNFQQDYGIDPFPGLPTTGISYRLPAPGRDRDW